MGFHFYIKKWDFVHLKVEIPIIHLSWIFNDIFRIIRFGFIIEVIRMYFFPFRDQFDIEQYYNIRYHTNVPGLKGKVINELWMLKNTIITDRPDDCEVVEKKEFT